MNREKGGASGCKQYVIALNTEQQLYKLILVLYPTVIRQYCVSHQIFCGFLQQQKPYDRVSYPLLSPVVQRLLCSSLPAYLSRHKVCHRMLSTGYLKP